MYAIDAVELTSMNSNQMLDPHKKKIESALQTLNINKINRAMAAGKFFNPNERGIRKITHLNSVSTNSGSDSQNLENYVPRQSEKKVKFVMHLLKQIEDGYLSSESVSQDNLKTLRTMCGRVLGELVKENSILRSQESHTLVLSTILIFAKNIGMSKKEFLGLATPVCKRQKLKVENIKASIAYTKVKLYLQ